MKSNIRYPTANLFFCGWQLLQFHLIVKIYELAATKHRVHLYNTMTMWKERDSVSHSCSTVDLRRVPVCHPKRKRYSFYLSFKIYLSCVPVCHPKRKRYSFYLSFKIYLSCVPVCHPKTKRCSFEFVLYNPVYPSWVVCYLGTLSCRCGPPVSP
jgi:hypothetical protein